MVHNQKHNWIVKRGYEFMVEVAILAIGVGIASWQEVATIYMIAGIVAWLALSIHRGLGSVLSELYQLNDQIAEQKSNRAR